MKVIVVGAGAAGLAAARALRQRGVEVAVFEKEDAAGGRARGFSREGYVFDLGAQFSARLCTTTLAVCRELGMEGDFIPFDFTAALYRDGRLHPVYAGRDLRGIWRHRRDLARFRGVPWGAHPQLARMGPALIRRSRDFDFESMDPRPVLDLCDLSIADFTLRHGGRKALEWGLQPLTSILTLGEPEEVGAAHILALIFGLSPGLVALRRGIGSLMQAMYESCADSVRLSTPVRRIVLEKGRAVGVETDAGTEEADAVVCAVTATAALRLLPGLPQSVAEPLRTVTYSSTAHFIFALRNRLLPEGWYGVSIPRSEGFIQPGFSDAAGKSPEFAPQGGGLVHSLTYGKRGKELERLEDEELKGMLIRELQAIVPGRMPDEPLMTVVARWPEAICLDPPGQARAIHYLRRDHYRDVPGLFLAGEYMYLVSCVEGALRSGLEAAGAVLSPARGGSSSNAETAVTW
jgi:oxygen-dependent protoporphyrinogen oxidase